MRPVFDLGRESRTIVLLAAYLGVGLGLYALSGWLTRQFGCAYRKPRPPIMYIGHYWGSRVGLLKALFMTVWRPSTRSAENSCGIRQG